MVRKLLIMVMFLGVVACATPLEYDRDKINLNPDVKMLNINTNNSTRERDGQMFVQVSGISAKNQSVYYKINWFDVNGMVVPTSLSQWKKVNLRENAEFIWNGVSPSKKAIKYRVQITDDIGNGIIE